MAGESIKDQISELTEKIKFKINKIYVKKLRHGMKNP